MLRIIWEWTTAHVIERPWQRKKGSSLLLLSNCPRRRKHDQIFLDRTRPSSSQTGYGLIEHHARTKTAPERFSTCPSPLLGTRKLIRKILLLQLLLFPSPPLSLYLFLLFWPHHQRYHARYTTFRPDSIPWLVPWYRIYMTAKLIKHNNTPRQSGSFC